MKILIIEDDQDIALMQKILLEGRGYEVQVLTKDFQSIFHTNWSNLDVVITDWKLCPSVTGEEILQHFKLKFPHVRRILISANMESVICKSLAHMWLAKPFCLLDLQVAIEGTKFKEEDGGATELRNTLHRTFWKKAAESVLP